LPDILDRLNVSAEGWLSVVSDFSRLFRRAADTPGSLTKEAEHRDRAWLHGVRNAQEVIRKRPDRSLHPVQVDGCLIAIKTWG
jgi:hypothetical protein